MIRLRLKELIAEKQFRESRLVTMLEVSEATGVHRITLSKIANQKGYNVGTEILDKLCAYFGCTLNDLAEYVADEHTNASSKKS